MNGTHKPYPSVLSATVTSARNLKSHFQDFAKIENSRSVRAGATG
jgi:hypothetical protein